MQSLGIKYLMRELISYINQCARGTKLLYTSYNVNDVSAISFIIWPLYIQGGSKK